MPNVDGQPRRIFKAMHIVCETQNITEVFEELTECDIFLDVGGNKVFGDAKIIGSDAESEGLYCNTCDRYISFEEIILGDEIQDSETDWLDELDHDELVSLIDAYDRYLENARQEDMFHDGWVPVCLHEFYTSDFKAWAR